MTVQGYLAHEMFHLQQDELEQQAAQHRLVGVAVRARLRNRTVAREARALRLASDAVGRASGPVPDRDSAVRTAR